MTSITCEASVFAEACQRAAKVAPVKGEAFDKAQGVILQVRPNSAGPLRIRSTDLQASFFQKVTGAIGTGVDADWRLPTQMLNGVASNLPVGTGKQVEVFDDDENFVHFHVGRQKAKLKRIDQSVTYPMGISDPFSPAEMASIDDLASRIQQVAWAVHDTRAPLSGIHIDGKYLWSTDGYKVCRVPCSMPVADPVTIPMGSLTGLLQSLGPVRVSATKDRFRLMLDDETQVTTTIYGERYPAMKSHLRDDFAGSMLVAKDELMDTINSMLVLVRGERYPSIGLGFSSGEIHLAITADEKAGEMTNVIDTTDVLFEEDFEVRCGPKFLVNALAASTKGQVQIDFGPRKNQTIRISDEGGYECHIVPIVLKD